jgi:hypothetical protein
MSLTEQIFQKLMEPNANIVSVLASATHDQVQALFDAGRIPRSMLNHWYSVNKMQEQILDGFGKGREEFKYHHDFDHVVLNLRLTKFNGNLTHAMNSLSRAIRDQRDLVKTGMDRHQLLSRKLQVADDDEKLDIQSQMVICEAAINNGMRSLDNILVKINDIENSLNSNGE